MRLLTITLNCTIIGHNDVLCKREDLAHHLYLYVYSILLKLNILLKLKHSLVESVS